MRENLILKQVIINIVFFSKSRKGETYMKRSRKKRDRKKILRVSLAIISALTLVFLSVVSVFSMYVDQRINTEIDLTLFENAGSDTVTRLYYFDEQGNAIELSGERLHSSHVTIYTSLGSMTSNLKNAFVAIEDKRYYSHHGVDWKRTASAGVNYILKSKATFGASTITQQLIKNVTGSDEITLKRKLQEIFYALDLESRMEKDEILELYLNIVNLSQGCYGVGAAAEKYFSKQVHELSLTECAAIAAITKSPSYYDPIKNPENNKTRRNVILSEMLAQGYITEEEYLESSSSELVLNVSEDTAPVNSWYTDMVVEDVIDDLTVQLGYTRAAASYLVYNGGLRIYTAMDPDVQSYVESYYADESNFPEDDREKGKSGIIIISSDNGDILGVAGDIGEKEANRIQSYATDSVRPSGSVIKPLSVYAPAMENGIINWASVYDDVPVEFYEDGDKYSTWPNNATKTYSGLSNINYAIQNSLNTVSVRVLSELGIDNSYDFLKNKLGITNLINNDKGIAALALGQQNYGLTLRELTAAYSIFSDGGVYNAPRSYILVMTNSGDVLLSKEKNSSHVISEENAAIMTKMLENVVDHGAASYTVSLRENIDVAGKTGTTQNTCDRWFVGFTPYYICGVWYGHEYPETLPSSTNTICSSTWNQVMTALHKEFVDSDSKGSFNVPDNVIQASFCKDSGKLMTGSCMLDPRGNRQEIGWFIDGDQPKSFCECHVTVPYDTRCNGIASEDCLPEDIINVGLIQVERAFPCQIYIKDAQYVARILPSDCAPCSEDSLPFFAHALGEGVYSGISDTDRQFNSGCTEHYSYSWWIFKRKE